MSNIIVLKAEEHYGHRVVLATHCSANRIFFRVSRFKNEEGSIAEYWDDDDIDVAMSEYKRFKDELCQKHFSLFEAIKHCRAAGFTPHQEAAYLADKGYCK